MSCLLTQIMKPCLYCFKCLDSGVGYDDHIVLHVKPGNVVFHTRLNESMFVTNPPMGKQILLDYLSYVGKVLWQLCAKERAAGSKTSSSKGDHIGRYAVATPWRTL